MQKLTVPNYLYRTSGGYDKSIVGWNLSAETDQPIFKLYGHDSVVVQVAGLIAGDRCISLGK